MLLRVATVEVRVPISGCAAGTRRRPPPARTPSTARRPCSGRRGSRRRYRLSRRQSRPCRDGTEVLGSGKSEMPCRRMHRATPSIFASDLAARGAAPNQARLGRNSWHFACAASNSGDERSVPAGSSEASAGARVWEVGRPAGSACTASTSTLVKRYRPGPLALMTLTSATRLVVGPRSSGRAPPARACPRRGSQLRRGRRADCGHTWAGGVPVAAS